MLKADQNTTDNDDLLLLITGQETNRGCLYIGYKIKPLEINALSLADWDGLLSDVAVVGAVIGVRESELNSLLTY